MDKFNIAVIEGDGIGKEVIPEGIKVLESLGEKFELSFVWDDFDWGCEYYSRNCKMMPGDALEKLAQHNTGNMKVSESVSHLFISDPNKSALDAIYSTHPPIEERIKRLRAM